MRRSAMSARSRPAPVAAPLMAAMTGLSSASSASGILCTWPSSSVLRSIGVRSPRFCISPMSPPLQNALPAPVTITTETVSLLLHSTSASAQASIISQVKAFMRSGRLSVMVAIPSAISKRRLSIMAFSSSRARYWQDRPRRAAREQARDQNQVQHVEGDARGEGRPVVGEPVIEGAAHPVAERHAQEAEEQDRADAPTGFLRGEEFADGENVARNNTAEADPERR